MKKLVLATLFAGTAAVSMSAVALAQGGPGMGPGSGGYHEPGGMMKMMMQNLDEISKDEVQAMKETHFAQADADGNGELTMEEMEAYHAARRAEREARRKQARFDRRDTDGNGVISLDEFESYGMPMFDRLDADDDGVVTTEEIEAMKDRRGKRGWHHRGGKPDTQD